MALRYYLVPNKLKNVGPGNYRAVTVTSKSVTLEELHERMTREGSTITTAESLANFEEYTRAILEAVSRGYSVVTPLVNFAPSVGGVFEGDADRFDPGRHKVNIKLTPGTRLRKTSGTIRAFKMEPTRRRPTPKHYYDNTTGSRDAQITPGGGARILGTLLKFDEEDERQGIFFIETPGKSAVRVTRGLLKNKPRELIFVNPELPPGTYTLEVRSLVPDTTVLRFGALQERLVVAE